MKYINLFESFLAEAGLADRDTILAWPGNLKELFHKNGYETRFVGDNSRADDELSAIVKADASADRRAAVIFGMIQGDEAYFKITVHRSRQAEALDIVQAALRTLPGYDAKSQGSSSIEVNRSSVQPDAEPEAGWAD